jgi:hypothetical protein
MSRRMLFLSLGILIIIGYSPAPVSAQGALLGVDVLTAFCGPSTLITIDTTTGAGTAIGPITGFPCVTGLAFAPDGTLYGVSDPAFGGTGDLIRIDPITGSATAVGPVGFPEVDDLAIAPDGTIFAAVNPVAASPAGPVLATIDPNTGAGTVIGPIGFCVEGLSFAPDGTLFGAADIFGCASAQTLITINTTTGVGTIIGPIGFPDVEGISFTSGGTLFGADLGSGTLITINPATGAGTAIGPTGFCCITGLAPSAQKEPELSIAQVTGGGQITPDSGGRASFGFVAQREEENDAVSGHFNYLNHDTGRHINGPVEAITAAAPTGPVTFSGTADDGDCTFKVTVEDKAEPGKGVDTFEMESSCEPPVSQRAISRGNIQRHF